jgi:hypothetical protein
MGLGIVVHGTRLDHEVVLHETFGDCDGGHVFGEVPKKDPGRVIVWSRGALRVVLERAF